jgi:competence protein ComEC
VFLASIFFIFNYYKKDKILNNILEQNLEITGFLSEIPKENEETYIYEIKVENVKNIKLPKFKIETASRFPINADIGEKFVANVKVFENNNLKSAIRYRARGIYFKGFFLNQNVKVLHKSKWDWNDYFYNFILKLKLKIIKKINKTFDQETAGLVKSIWLGERDSFSLKLRNDFSIAGVSHLLAVSGIHVSVLTQFAYSFLNLLRLRRRVSSIICIIFISIFVCITCFPPSAVRAGIMIIIWLAGRALFMRSDSLNSLGISVFIISILMPNSCLDIGLWLSFLSSLGIIVFSNKFYNFFKERINFLDNKFFKYIFSNLSTSIITILCTFPLIIFYFRRISIFSIISNIIIIFPVIILLNLSIISILLSMWSNISFWSILTNFVSKFIILAVKFIANLPFASISLDYSFLNIWISFTFFIVAYFLFFSNLSKEFLKISLISVFILFSGIISYQISLRNKIRLNFICSGKNRSFVISKNKNYAIVADKIFNINNKLQNLNFRNPDLIIGFGENIENIYKISDFFKKFDSKNLILSNEIKQNFFKIPLWEQNSHMTFLKIKNKTWVRIKLKNKKILICLEGGNACDLPKFLRKCDMFAAYGLPVNFNLIETNNLILAMNPQQSKINFKKTCSFNTFASFGQDVLIDVSDDDYVLKRKS